MYLPVFRSAAVNVDVTQILYSTLAILFSFAALCVTVFKNRLTRRQDLTATIAELARIQIAALELQASRRSKTEEGVSIRRVYSLQRRFYTELSSRLIDKLSEAEVSEIDHNLLATAYAESSNPVMAERHWICSVDKSQQGSTLRATNLRGLARFYFRQGRFEDGRRRYQESLQEQLFGDYDAFRKLRSDTYRMWAKEEIEAGFASEGERLMQAALAELLLIRHATQRQQQREYVELLRNMLDASPSANGPATDAVS
jgi:hypothetical protein